MSQRPILLSFILVLSLLAVGSGCQFQKILKKGTPEEKLTAAKKYYNKGDYIRAMPLLNDLLTAYRRKPEAEEIYYYYSYCHYGMGDYIMAAYNFKNFAETYPRSEHAEETAFMAAKCEYYQSLPYYLDQTNTRKAIEKIQLFINRYPGSSYVEEGNKLIDELRSKLHTKAFELAMLYFHMENYKSAYVSFKNLIADYPDFPRKELCEYLVVKSAYLYAKQSFLSSQEERYQTALDEGDLFLEGESTNNDYRSEVTEMVEKSAQNIENVKRLLKVREVEKEIEKQNSATAN